LLAGTELPEAVIGSFPAKWLYITVQTELNPAERDAVPQSSVLVRILSEGCQADVPQPMRGYASPIHPALTAPWDLQLLSSRVRQLIQLVLMPVSEDCQLYLCWVRHLCCWRQLVAR
jgi:hypothetical protein